MVDWFWKVGWINLVIGCFVFDLVCLSIDCEVFFVSEMGIYLIIVGMVVDLWMIDLGKLLIYVCWGYKSFDR